MSTLLLLVTHFWTLVSSANPATLAQLNIHALWAQEVGPHIYVWDGETLYKYLQDWTLVAYSDLREEPLKIMERNNEIYVYTISRGVLKLYKYDRAMVFKYSKIIEENVNILGVTNDFIVTNDKIIHYDQVRPYTLREGELLLVPMAHGYKKLPYAGVLSFCKLSTFKVSNIYIFDNITFIIFNDEGVFKLLNVSTDNVKCLTLGNTFTLKYNVLRSKDKNYFIENGVVKADVRVPGCTLEKFLGTLKSRYTHNEISVLWLSCKGKQYLASVRVKDSNPQLAWEMPNKFINCFLVGNHVDCLAQNSIRLNEVDSPYTQLELTASQSLLNLVRRGVKINYAKLIDVLSRKQILLKQFVKEFKEVTLVPTSFYMIDIGLDVGRAIEFVPTTPPFSTFDPPQVEVIISPDVIIPYIYNLTLQVYDAETQKPIPGAIVEIQGTTARGSTVLKILTTDAKGMVRVELEKGVYNIKISHPYYYTKSIVGLKLTKNMKLKIFLKVKGSVVKINVLSKGAPPFIPRGPIAGAKVSISGPMTLTRVTNSAGTIKVTLRPGTYLVNITAPYHKPLTTTLVVSLNDIGKVKNVVYTLVPDLVNLRLRIIDAMTKRPVIPKEVIIYNVGLKRFKDIKNPPTPVINERIPKGTYKITVLANGFQKFEKVFDITKDVEITIPLQYKTIPVTIIVLDELRKPVPSFNVTLENLQLGLKFKFSLTSQNNTIQIPPGLYRITVSAPGFEKFETQQQITEQTTSITLVIARKTYPVTVQAVYGVPQLKEVVDVCTGTIRGGPLPSPLNIPKMFPPRLSYTLKLPRGSYVVTISCTNRVWKVTVATGTSNFVVPKNSLVKVTLNPTRITISFIIKDIRTDKPVKNAKIEIYTDPDLKNKVAEGYTNVIGEARISIPSWLLGKSVWVKVIAPGYVETKQSVIVNLRGPANIIYLKPAPTIIEIILGNPPLLIALIAVAGISAYIASTFLRKGEEEEIFEELV